MFTNVVEPETLELEIVTEKLSLATENVENEEIGETGLENTIENTLENHSENQLESQPNNQLQNPPKKLKLINPDVKQQEMSKNKKSPKLSPDMFKNDLLDKSGNLSKLFHELFEEEDGSIEVVSATKIKLRTKVSKSNSKKSSSGIDKRKRGETESVTRGEDNKSPESKKHRNEDQTVVRYRLRSRKTCKTVDIVPVVSEFVDNRSEKARVADGEIEDCKIDDAETENVQTEDIVDYKPKKRSKWSKKVSKTESKVTFNETTQVRTMKNHRKKEQTGEEPKTSFRRSKRIAAKSILK